MAPINGGDQQAGRDILIYFYRRSVELVLQSVVHLYRPYCAHESTNLFKKMNHMHTVSSNIYIYFLNILVDHRSSPPLHPCLQPYYNLLLY